MNGLKLGVPLLIVRADANAQIGAGHIMRCFALAQGWQAQGGQVIFITNCKSESLQQRLMKEGFGFNPVEENSKDCPDHKASLAVLEKYLNAWVALDGYHFDETYQLRIKEMGHRLLVFDDTAHLQHYHSDVILNQNINAEYLHYSRELFTRLLLGLRYVVLRSEFLGWKGRERMFASSTRRVLVTLGGGDPDNQTLKVIRALRRIGLKDLQVKVVVGAANPHSAVLESASRSCSFPIQLVRDARNMAELMAWADLAVSAGGSTCWEMAFMGLPCVILVLAENQQGIAKGIGEAGSGVNLGWFEGVTEGDILDTLSNLLSDPSRLRALSNMAKGLIDGKGRERIVSVLQEYKGSPCRKGI